MRDTDLLQMALGLLPPWMVAGSTLDAAAKRLDIHLDFPRGSRFACPDCGSADCPAYDTEEMMWRHLNFFQHEAYLHARVPRVRCRGCGVKRVSVAWARDGSGFTLLFEGTRSRPLVTLQAGWRGAADLCVRARASRSVM